MIIPNGTKVEIIKEPIFYDPTMNNYTGGLRDMKHMIGLTGVIENFFPLMLGDRERIRKEAIGWYQIKFDKLPEKGIPIGLATEGFTSEFFKII